MLGHIPIALVEGRSVVAAMVGTLVGALAYALLYLLTRNVYLVAVVHGVGNVPPAASAGLSQRSGSSADTVSRR